MLIKRLGILQIALVALLLVAWPVAMFHLSSGRPAQALMAAGASLVGLVLAVSWMTRQSHGGR